VEEELEKEEEIKERILDAEDVKLKHYRTKKVHRFLLKWEVKEEKFKNSTNAL
jgi:hypothetical protein